MRISDWNSDVCSSDLTDLIILDVDALQVQPFVPGYDVLGGADEPFQGQLFRQVDLVLLQKCRRAVRLEALRHEKLSPIFPDILVAINNLHVGWRVRQLWKRRSIALQMTALGIHPKVDVRELGQQIGKAGEKGGTSGGEG